MERTTISDAKLLTPWGVIDGGHVVMEGGRIVSAGPVAPEQPGNTLTAGGALVCAGLMDIHIHGSLGRWGFMGRDELLELAAVLPRFGVTAFCPATVSLPHAQVMEAVRGISEAMDAQEYGGSYEDPAGGGEPRGARILGAHLEGPYISKKRPGAHNPAAIRDPEPAEVGEVLEAAAGCIRIATIAPEVPGGMELLSRLDDEGIVVSIGHSDADREQTLDAVRAGARLVTHLFNALRPFHQREVGNTFAALLTQGIYCELIADGKHSHADAIRIAAGLKDSSELILVTDAIAAAGMGDGKYPLWGFEVKVEDGAATLPGGTLAGSVLTMDRAVANMSEFTGLGLDVCLNMATCNPAKLLGLLPRAGALVPGAAADIAVFSRDMRCLATLVAGQVVYRAEDSPV